MTVLTSTNPAPAGPCRPVAPPPSSATALLNQATHDLTEAQWQEHPAAKFAQGYLAALRAAAAMLALRGRPHRGRSRPTSAWLLLAKVAPEHAEWAAFFESASPVSASIQAGINRQVSARVADDLVRQAAQFLELVDAAVAAGTFR